jgi:hypothetical protein
LGDYRGGAKAGFVDTDCKLDVLGNSIIFFVTGIGKTVDGSGRVVVDPQKVALEAYQSTTPFLKNRSVKDVAEAWGASMDAVYRHDYAMSGENLFVGVPLNQLSVGGFAGIGADSTIDFYLMMNVYKKASDGSVKFTHQLGTVTPNELGGLIPIGFEKYVNEFSERKSARAQKVWSSMATAPHPPLGSISERSSPRRPPKRLSSGARIAGLAARFPPSFWCQASPFVGSPQAFAPPTNSSWDSKIDA